METEIAVGLAAAVVALSKVVEWLVKKVWPSDEKSNDGFATEHERQLRSIYESVHLLMERDMGAVQKNQERMAECLENVAKCLEKVAQSQERAAEALEKIERRQEIDDELRRRQERPAANG